MKNYVSLVSILALTACATSGSGPDDRFRVSSSSKYMYATETAVESNKAVTSMNSEIVICSGDCHDPANRVGGKPSRARVFTMQQGSAELSVYDLSDVKFTIADEGFEPGEESFTFVIDDSEANGTRGKIIGIDMDFEEDDSFPETKEAILTRQNETNVFNGFVNDPDSNSDPDKWKPAKYTYESLGKNKLKFSDFGTLHIERTDDVDKSWAPVFIGGYDDAKKIDPTSVAPQTLEFFGQIAGSVVAVLNGQGSGTSIDLNDNTAQLKLFVSNNGVNSVASSEVKAEFNNWYDMVYTETGASKEIVLSNYEGTNDFKMLTAESEGKVTISGDNSEDSFVKSDIRYFGDNGTPSEAVGIIQVRDCNGVACTNDYGTHTDPKPEVRINLGFGVSK